MYYCAVERWRLQDALKQQLPKLYLHVRNNLFAVFVSGHGFAVKAAGAENQKNPAEDI